MACHAIPPTPLSTEILWNNKHIASSANESDKQGARVTSRWSYGQTRIIDFDLAKVVVCMLLCNSTLDYQCLLLILGQSLSLLSSRQESSYEDSKDKLLFHCLRKFNCYTCSRTPAISNMFSRWSIRPFQCSFYSSKSMFCGNNNLLL